MNEDLGVVSAPIYTPDNDLKSHESIEDGKTDVSFKEDIDQTDQGDISTPVESEDAHEHLTRKAPRNGNFPDDDEEEAPGLSPKPVTEKLGLFGRLFGRLRAPVASRLEPDVGKLSEDIDDSNQTLNDSDRLEDREDKGNKISDSAENTAVTTQALTDEEKLIDITLDSDDFDNLFEDDTPKIDSSLQAQSARKNSQDKVHSELDSTLFESNSLASQAQPPLINPEDLGLLQLYDEHEASESDVSPRMVESQDKSTDLVEELEDLENFLEIQSKLVGHTDVHDKTNLGLVNIDSAEVKFAIAEAYIKENNKTAALDLLEGIMKQKDEHQEKAKLMLEKL